MKRTLGAFLLVVLAPLTACDGGGGSATAAEPADPATTTLHVHFTDSSVPPEHHRSWDLTLDQDTVHLVVDSYGDVLTDETVDMPAGEWEDFVEELEDGLDGIADPEDVEMCPGGTSISLDVSGAGDQDTSIEAHNCAGSNEDTRADIRSLVERFTDLVDLDRHLRT